MDVHRWSALLRGYDLRLRYNRLILILSAAGALVGLVVGERALWPSVWRAFVGGAVVFIAAALAKELLPDRPWASLPAAIVALPLAWLPPLPGAVALFWVLGCLRLLNRATGLRPKWLDVLILLAVTLWLSWRISPLFGVLFGLLLLIDALLPDGQRYHAAGLLLAIAAAVWLIASDEAIAPSALWAVVLLLLIAVAFIAVILGSYSTTAVGDATGEPLSAARVQAGQAFALSTGLFLASWLGEAGIVLLIGLWAALLGVLIYHLIWSRLRRPVATL